MNHARKRLSVVTSAIATAVLSTGLGVAILPASNASAGSWTNCPVDPSQTIMFAQVRDMSCSQARKLGNAAIKAWDGRSRNVSVQGFSCKMRSGLPYHVAISGTCKKGSVAAKFSTGD